MKLLSHNELRLALTTGLINAFGSLSGIADSYYSALTVPAVLTGSYGGSIELGRQRILGSILGALILVIGLKGLKGIPLPVAIAISMGCLRLLGGALGLKVGYKAGGLLLIMGWLVHGDQLNSWIPLRLAWTIVGILVALLSLRLFWPQRALDQSMRMLAVLSDQIQTNLDRLAARIDPNSANPPRQPAALAAVTQLRKGLNDLRRQTPALLKELGSNPRRHPAYRFIQLMDDANSRLVGSVVGMERHAPPMLGDAELVRILHQAEHDLLQTLARRVGAWAAIFAAAGPKLPPPPSQPIQLPQSWLSLEILLSDPICNQASLERLERIASRLVLCRQAQQAIEDAELRWAGLMNG